MAILAVFLFLLWYFYPTICQWRDEMLDIRTLSVMAGFQSFFHFTLSGEIIQFDLRIFCKWVASATTN